MVTYKKTKVDNNLRGEANNMLCCTARKKAMIAILGLSVSAQYYCLDNSKIFY